MLKKHISFFLFALLVITYLEDGYSQDSTYKLLRFISGSGGVLFSQNAQYFHYATAGENILGNAQNQNNFIRSGFWSYPLLGPSEVKENQQTTKPTVFQLHQNYPNPFNDFL